MKTTEERLRFAVYFAQVNLATLRYADRLKLNNDLMVFWRLVASDDIRLPQWDYLALNVGMREEREVVQHGLTNDELYALQQKARDMLLSVGGETKVGSVGFSLEYRIIPQGKGRIFSYRGSIPDVFIYALGRLLELRSDRIRRCPECTRLFVRTRRQLYCRSTCVDRVNKRQWRKAQEAKAKTRKRRAKAA